MDIILESRNTFKTQIPMHEKIIKLIYTVRIFFNHLPPPPQNLKRCRDWKNLKKILKTYHHQKLSEKYLTDNVFLKFP